MDVHSDDPDILEELYLHVYLHSEHEGVCRKLYQHIHWDVEQGVRGKLYQHTQEKQ